MDQNQDESWFYSQDGQQHGPLPFTDLQAKVSAGDLHPVDDLVWKNGMANWTPVGELHDAFKQAEPTPEPTPDSQPKLAPVSQLSSELQPQPTPQTKSVNKPYIQAPTAIEESASDKKKMKANIQGDWKGANRLHYLLGLFVFPVVLMVALIFVAPMFGQKLGIFAALASILLITLVSLVVTLKRFTNLVMSRWWFLGLLVPILNLWLYYRLIACPPGYAEHKKIGSVGIALALTYWLSLIGFVAAGPIIAVMALTMALDNPEMMNDPEMRAEYNKILIELRKVIEQM